LSPEIKYLSEKVHVHRWPQDSPEWGDSTQKQIDDSINKNSKKKQVTIKEKTIQIENFEFISLKKIGITVPFFKKECTLIFEAQFCKLYAHVHITIKSENYVDVFNELTSWKNRIFPNDS
jgi:tRNA/tmRNA/rRNA uracil-C5-methylase (TrmA/RlmC/RlmD family)